jgi:hypothetical protein
MNTLPKNPVLTHAEEDAMWATLTTDPAAITSVKNATADMQAFALRRRSYLIFKNVNWVINPEHVCPGITAWKRVYQHRHTKQNLESNFMMGVLLLTEMVTTFEPIRKLAFMPQVALNAEVRRYLLNTPFKVSVKCMEKIAMKHWGSGRYPENDVKGRMTSTIETSGA